MSETAQAALTLLAIVVGIAIGAPLGIQAGKLHWRIRCYFREKALCRRMRAAGFNHPEPRF